MKCFDLSRNDEQTQGDNTENTALCVAQVIAQALEAEGVAAPEAKAEADGSDNIEEMVADMEGTDATALMHVLREIRHAFSNLNHNNNLFFYCASSICFASR